MEETLAIYNKIKYAFAFYFSLFLILTWVHFFIAFRETGKEREKHWCKREASIHCLPNQPGQGLNTQPRYVSWPGIEPTTFQLQDDAPTKWATPARTVFTF